ncbi:MAG: hypothetical protein V5A55_05690 [Halovenus sp.]
MVSELTTVPAVARFPVGLGAATVAILAMDLVMRQLPEGVTPPNVAAGVLTGTPPDRAPRRLSTVVHYLAGYGTGLLFVYFLLVAEWVLDGASLAGVVATAAVLYVLMVAFFVLVPLPRARGVDGERRRAIARDWAVAAAAYLVVLVPVTVGVTVVVA